jgi:serine/threonine protein kinase
MAEGLRLHQHGVIHRDIKPPTSSLLAERAHR